jgi:cytochrome c oxidase subunit 2
MTRHPRARWRRIVAFAPLLILALAACGPDVPNSIFGAHSEHGHTVDDLTRFLLELGLGVFVFVEALLIFAVFKFRYREGGPPAKQIHGNTTLEIGWTFIPAVLLALIAIPTVRIIFTTEAPAPAGALQVEVIGHQWWWEFRYPEFNVVTANELYLPKGRTVNFSLRTNDVLHSFWMPQLNGKRDLISNRTNHLWFTPDSIGAYNGFCAEFCGASHANMRFKVFVVAPEQFTQYIAHEQSPPVFPLAVDTTVKPAKQAKNAPPPPPAMLPLTAAQMTTGTWPLDQLPKWVIPATPLPTMLSDTTPADAGRGAATFRTAPCIACHTIQGVSAGVIGPNLTHVGSRTTIAAGLYPNDHAHLVAWIMDAPEMKPGSQMMMLGQRMMGPGGLTDQQIADIAAYLSALK